MPPCHMNGTKLGTKVLKASQCEFQILSILPNFTMRISILKDIVRSFFNLQLTTTQIRKPRVTPTGQSWWVTTGPRAGERVNNSATQPQPPTRESFSLSRHPVVASRPFSLCVSEVLQGTFFRFSTFYFHEVEF